MILVDGLPATGVDARDRGLHYGDGLFETLAVVNGEARLWERHMARMLDGCKRLGIPEPDPAQLRSEAGRLTTGVERGVLKLMITRGSGGRGYAPPAAPSPRRILILNPWPEHPIAHWRDGIRLRLCSTPLGCNPALAGIKHLNRLEQVLARREWDDPAVAEGLMLDTGGRVVEGTMTNLFLVKGGELLTPDLSRCGVAGIMRGQVLAVAGALGLPIHVVPSGMETVRTADELFLTNSLIGIWPVRRFEENDYPVGPITLQVKGILEAELGAFHA